MEESKFNFSGEYNQDQALEQSKEAIKQEAKGLLTSLKYFITELLDTLVVQSMK